MNEGSAQGNNGLDPILEGNHMTASLTLQPLTQETP